MMPTADSGWDLLSRRASLLSQASMMRKFSTPMRFFILTEVGLAGGFVTVSAGFSEVGVSSEAFNEVLDVGYLLYLA